VYQLPAKWQCPRSQSVSSSTRLSAASAVFANAAHRLLKSNPSLCQCESKRHVLCHPFGLTRPYQGPIRRLLAWPSSQHGICISGSRFPVGRRENNGYHVSTPPGLSHPLSLGWRPCTLLIAAPQHCAGLAATEAEQIRALCRLAARRADSLFSIDYFGVIRSGQEVSRIQGHRNWCAGLASWLFLFEERLAPERRLERGVESLSIF
jgi:hypothetical protein